MNTGKTVFYSSDGIFSAYEFNKCVSEFFVEVKKMVLSGIQVFAVRIPIFPKNKYYEDHFIGYNHNKFVQKFTKAGGIWLDVNQHGYHTYDGTHLIKEDAEVFSKCVALGINKYINSSDKL